MTRSLVAVCAALMTVTVAGAGLRTGPRAPDAGPAQQHAGSYTPADVEAGARLYGSNCSACHGADGALVAAVDLRRGVFRFGSTDEQLANTIARGIPGTAMTPQTFSAAELHALVAYLRSMRDFGSRAVAAGDARIGSTLVESKGCLSCHRLGGRGGIFSVDLTDIGAARSADAIHQALSDGTNSVAPQRRFIRAVTADGKTVAGRRLNEDTFTVQLIDERGELRSLDKSGLREYTTTRTSPRPAGKEKLTPEERAHLTAFLSGLRGIGPAAGSR